MNDLERAVRIKRIALYVVTLVAFAGGYYVGWLDGQRSDPERTCKSVALEQKALEICLKYRPTCESVTIEDFVVYYDNKDWLDAICPANSGDGFLSQ